MTKDDQLIAAVKERDERIRELEQRIADLGPWTVKDLRQYAEDTVADFRSLREQLKTTQERLAEAESALNKIGSFGVVTSHLIDCSCVFCFDVPYTVKEYFTKHEKP